jgi:hypothetical protein
MEIDYNPIADFSEFVRAAVLEGKAVKWQRVPSDLCSIFAINLEEKRPIRKDG